MTTAGPQAGAAPANPLTLQQLLRAMVERGGSDLHITTGSPPQIRIDGRLVMVKSPPLTPTDTKTLCYSVMTEAQKSRFEEDWELDMSFGIKGLARFRANFFMQRGAVAGVFRIIPFKILSFHELGLPAVLADLARRPRGIVFVTGPTGSGKTTTLAALIDLINTEFNHHIVTIEDPIEYLHPHKNCLVNQRELGADTKSYSRAMRSLLREDPDVALIGEIRDLETCEAALRVAETGHLVFATMHTNGAIPTINRIIDMFPPHQQDQVRAQISFSITGVVSQILVPRLSGGGRALAMEIMVPTPAIRALIRDDKVHQIYGQMQIGTKFGMQTFNQHLQLLYNARQISLDEALARSPEPNELKEMIKGNSVNPISSGEYGGGAPRR